MPFGQEVVRRLTHAFISNYLPLNGELIDPDHQLQYRLATLHTIYISPCGSLSLRLPYHLLPQSAHP